MATVTKLLMIVILCPFYTWGQKGLNISSKKVSFGHKVCSNRTINTIIIHSTFNNSGGEKYNTDLVIKQFEKYGVSSHYLINRDGKVYLLVEENNVAFHAGKSELPNGQTNVNTCSIGIEIITSFDEGPTESQINSAIKLIKEIKKKHQIKYILRHSDIAQGRKTDPWNFDWDGFIKLLEE